MDDVEFLDEEPGGGERWEILVFDVQISCRNGVGIVRIDLVEFLFPWVIHIVRVDAQSNYNIKVNCSIKEPLEGALVGRETVPSSDNKENLAVLFKSLLKQKFKAIHQILSLGPRPVGTMNEREFLERTNPKSTICLLVISHHRSQRSKQLPQDTVAALGRAINTMSSIFHFEGDGWNG